MQTEPIKNLIARHTPPEGGQCSPLEGIQLFRVVEPVERLPGVYSPAICMVAEGRKHAYLDGRCYAYESGHFLCGTMPLPVEGEVPFASEDQPLLGLTVDLESQVMAEAVVEYEACIGLTPKLPAVDTTPGFVVSRWEPQLSDALQRLLELLDDPLSQRVLAKARLRELCFAILQSAAAPHIRRAFGSAHHLSQALNHIRDNLHQALTVDELAERAGMSRAVFDRRFKEATSYSPLQFIKALRLNEAAMRIAQGMSISQAADSVGYFSSSQFSREFKRHFGATPREWWKSSEASIDIPGQGF